jgi:phage shock protein C
MLFDGRCIDIEKKLYRSTENKVLAGVCGGIGEYFGIDPVIVRLLVVLFTLMGGSGLIAYIIAAIIIPSREIMDRAEKTYQTYTDENGESYQESYSEENDIKSTRSEKGSHITFGIIRSMVSLFGKFIHQPSNSPTKS